MLAPIPTHKRTNGLHVAHTVPAFTQSHYRRQLDRCIATFGYPFTQGYAGSIGGQFHTVIVADDYAAAWGFEVVR